MNLKKKWMLVFAVGTLFLLYTPITALADSTDVKKVLNQYRFESHSVGGDVGRKIGWGVVTGLHWLVKGIEGVVYNINSTIGGFFRSAEVTNLQQNKIMPLTIALLSLVILLIGILFMIKPRNFTTIAGNLVIGIVIALGLPTFLSGAYDLTTQAIQFLDTNENGSSAATTSSLLSDRILVDNITDNTMYDDSNFQKPKNKNQYAASGSDITQIEKIDPTEVIDPEKTKHPDVWKNKLTTDKEGKQSLSGLWDGKIGLISIPDMTQYYYRWDIDWFTIISTLVITAFALILSGIKIARLLYELAINQTLTQIVALLDLVTAQRVKRCLQMLISTLFTLFAVFFMLQIYIIGNAYIAKADNPFLRLLLMIALAWSVIDGPNLFEQIFGIDAGVHNAVRTMYGMKAAGSIMAGSIAFVGGKGALDSLRTKGALGTAKGAVGKAGSVVGGAGGIAAGMASGAADNRRRYTAVRNGQSDPSQGQKSSVCQDKSGVGPAQPTVSNRSGNGPQGSAAAAEHPQTSRNSFEDREPQHSPIFSANSQEEPVSDSAFGSGRPDFTKGAVQGNQKIKTEPQASTIGGYVGNKVSQSFQNSGAVRSARRMYSLAYGGRLAHGDKKVQQEALAYQKMQSEPSLTHYDAVRSAKQDIRKSNQGQQSGDEKK